MRLTSETIRRKFLEQFAHASESERKGTIEALVVMDEIASAKGKPAPAAPLFEEGTEEAGK